VIAVLIGVVLFGERAGAADVCGMLLMLAAAGLVLRLQR
jgi:multidrug transporter EmrE-like cation transporter